MVLSPLRARGECSSDQGILQHSVIGDFVAWSRGTSLSLIVSDSFPENNEGLESLLGWETSKEILV